MSIPARPEHYGLAGQAAAFAARLCGWSGAPLVAADVTAIRYAVVDLDAQGQITASGPLAPADVMTAALTADAAWLAAGGDAAGYNLRAILPGSAFPRGNHLYQVELRIALADAEPLAVLWRYYAEALYA